ncbi:MAG: glycosyltransferase family 4 protein [Ferruginibacter sp.]
MRILIICGAGYVSGKEKIMLSLLKGFSNDGHEVYCMTSSWGNGQFENMLVSEKINFSKIRLGFISKTFNWSAFKMTLGQAVYWPKLIYDYKKIVSRFKPDVVIHSNFHHLFLLYPAVRSKKAVHIYHSHESIYNTKFYRRLFTLFQKKIKFFIGVSGYVTNKMINLGIDSSKAKAIQNGVEIIKWIPRPFNQDETFNIGIAGQVGGWKGHEDLVLAISILKNKIKHVKFKLNIFGEGRPEYTNELKNIIAENNLEEFVEWKGFVKDISNIYAGLNVVCIPTRTEEPFATSALEAGLFALPVIVTNKGGFPEIVQHGYSGFIVNANAPEEIADCLAVLINDPGKAMQMGLNHQRVVTEKFSYQHFINNWENTLLQLTAG